MGLTDRIEGFASNMKTSAQATSVSLATFSLRTLTGLILGYVFGLIVQEIMQTGTLVVLGFVVVTTAVFMKISSDWSFLKVLLFDIFCALVLQVLKMYIMLAP